MASPMTSTDGAAAKTGLPGDRQAIGSAVHVGLWRAVSDLAQTWARLPLVQRFAAELPRNASQRSTGIPRRLQEMEAGGGQISAQPLLVSISIGMMQQMPSLQAQPSPQQWESWLEVVRRVEAAHRLTVAWLRSRIPGYPSLPAPHLAPGTPLTTTEFTDQLIWTQNERAQGLQFQNPPTQISQALQATSAQQRHIDDGMRTLAAAFERTSEWARLAAATTAITDSGRADLQRARETLIRQLDKGEVDAHSQFALARYNFRVTVLNEALSVLTGSAQEYATAFTDVNKLIQAAASDVFGELAVYGKPATLTGSRDIDLRPGTFQLVSFNYITDATKTSPLNLGQIVWLGDALVCDAVRLTGTTVTIDDQIGATERWTGIILPGAGIAWKPSGFR